MLIIRFKPLWNVFIQGFGINAPGAGREKQRRSMWDTLHPGRPRQRDCSNDENAAEISKQIAEFLAGKIAPKIGAAEAARAARLEAYSYGAGRRNDVVGSSNPVNLAALTTKARKRGAEQ